MDPKPTPPPPVARSWDRIEAWLAVHAPRTLDALLPPAAPDAIDAAARRLGVSFPDELAASLLRHDGCAPEGPGRLVPRYGRLSPLDVICANAESVLDALRRVDGDLLSGAYWHREFVRFTDNSTADGLVVDCRAGATRGAVGSFFNGEGTTFGLWSGFAEMLAALADALETGGSLIGERPTGFGGSLYWERIPDEQPDPRSLFDVAARAGARPAAVRPPERFAPVPEAGWVGEYGRGFCLTFVHGVGAEELLRRYGALPETVAPRGRAEARDETEAWTSGYLPIVRAGTTGEWVFGFEDGPGRQGSRPEVLRRLSVGTRAVCLHHDSRHTTLNVIEDGLTVAGFNTHHPDQAAGTDAELLSGALRRVRLLPLDLSRFPDEDVYAALDALAETLDIAFDDSVLATRLISARILPVLGTVASRGAFSADTEPAIAAMLACAPEARLREALFAQVRRLAAETGLNRYAEVAEALERGANGVNGVNHANGADGADSAPQPLDDSSPLGTRLRLVAAEAQAANRSRSDPATRSLLTDAERRAWTKRGRAVDALRAVLDLAPGEAAFEVLHQRTDPNWRAQFAADLGELEIPEGTAERLQEAQRREAEAQRSQRTPQPAVRLTQLDRPQRRPRLPNTPQRHTGAPVPRRGNGSGHAPRRPDQ